MKHYPIFALFALALCPPAAFAQAAPASGPAFANGLKIGEVTPTSTDIWARLTRDAQGNPLATQDAAPGAEGSVAVRLWKDGTDKPVKETARRFVDAGADYTTVFRVDCLEPATDYHIELTGYDTAGHPGGTLTGDFRTAPRPDVPAAVKAAIVTCQGIGTTDDPRLGHRTYKELAGEAPDFFVHTGDVVYYDKDYDGLQPLSKSVKQAHDRWQRMFSYKWDTEFLRHVPCFFMKDDHDTLKDDCWPGQTYGDLTFAEGVRIAKEETGVPDVAYRTVRWGKDLQVWLLEGREYRDPNPEPDVPGKTILGTQQRDWLKDTLTHSDATFRIVISPTPIFGPDKPGKADSLANAAYYNEGEAMRHFLAAQKNTFVICGDRHWQYASTDPETGLREFGSGPINAKHAEIGGNPGMLPQYQYFGGGVGGYLILEVRRRDGHPEMHIVWHSISDDAPGAPVTHEVTIPAVE